MGYTASVLVQRIDFSDLGKRYTLYDLFEWRDGDGHTLLSRLHDAGLYDEVQARFEDQPAVRIVKDGSPTRSSTLPEASLRMST